MMWKFNLGRDAQSDLSIIPGRVCIEWKIAESNDQPSIPYCRDLHDNGFNGTIPELSILWNLLKLYVFHVHFLGLLSEKAIRPWLLTILEFSLFESVTVLLCRFTWDYIPYHFLVDEKSTWNFTWLQVWIMLAGIVGQFFKQLLKIGLAKCTAVIWVYVECLWPPKNFEL